MFRSALAFSLVAALVPSTAWAGFCTGKQNGLWCDGAKLVTCKDGNVSASQDCPAGCESMPPGVPDKCKASGPCAGKANGLWCSGSQLVTCKNGGVTASQNCPNGCQSMPDGVPDQCKAGSGPCAGKQDGKWCSGSELLTCKAGAVASQQHCDNGCTSKPPGVPDECTPMSQPPDPPKDWCDGKANGKHCDGATSKACQGGKTAGSEACAKGCGGAAGKAACLWKTSGFCSGKGDGLHCDGALLTTCGAGASKGVQPCAQGCVQMPDGVPDQCKSVAPPPQAGSDGKLAVVADGACGKFTGSLDLWGGKGLPVYDQTAYSQQLGSCGGFTIHSSGCTITALAMLHALLGLDRDVGGKTGHTPVIENEWRTQHGGYAATTYTWNGKPMSGKCLVIWATAPGALVPAPFHNDSAACLTTKTAEFIAKSLDGGMPVVAGVHWNDSPANHFGETENWHWVLVVGADKNGLLINDPWGGKERIRLENGALGKYVVDSLVSFWVGGKGGGSGAIDGNGDPVPDEDLPGKVVFIDVPPAPTPTEADAVTPDAAGADAAGPTGRDTAPELPTDHSATGQPAPASHGPSAAPPSSGCAAARGPSPNSAWVLVILGLVGLARRQRGLLAARRNAR